MKKLSKIILITSVILAALAVIYLVWIYFIQPNNLIKTSIKENGGVTTTSKISSENLKILSDQLVFDYWLKPDGEIYFLNFDGEIYKISPSDQEEKITEQKIQNISKIRASTDGNKVIISFGYPTRETFTVFDTNNKNWQALPEETRAADWHPTDNNQLAILQTQNNNSNLLLYNLANQKSQKILSFNQQDFDLDWPAADKIYLNEKSSASTRSSLWVISPSKKTIQAIIKEERGLGVKWFDDGGIKFTSNNRGGNLDIIDENGFVLSRIKIPTLPNKCVAKRSEIYCASSDRLEEIILPDDYLKGKEFSYDDIYLINRNLEGLILPVYSSLINGIIIDAWNLKISSPTPSKSEGLIFINRLNNKLYYLPLS